MLKKVLIGGLRHLDVYTPHTAWYKSGKKWKSSWHAFDWSGYDLKKGKVPGKKGTKYIAYKDWNRYKKTKKKTVKYIKKFKKRVKYKI